MNKQNSVVGNWGEVCLMEKAFEDKQLQLKLSERG